MTAQAKTEPANLPPAPPSPVDAAGQPAFGAYAGECGDLSFARLERPYARGPLWRMFHAKRWHFASISGPRLVTAFCVVDVGYAANAFIYLFDREAKRMLADRSFMGLPGLMAKVSLRAGTGARTSWSGGGARLVLERGGASWHVQARGPGGLEIEAILGDPPAPTLCAIARIEGGVANVTHKSACLPVQGTVRLGDRRWDLDGHTGAIDHTYGLLARDTTWRWVSAARADLGLNLVQGFNGPVENVVWHDGRIHPVGAAENRLRRTRPRSGPGASAATMLPSISPFRPEGERRQDKDLIIARSRYVQPVGVFSGTIRLPGGELQVDDLVGVTEDHTARW